ncbi:hypothetical protein HK14_06265 [Acetobacter cibinongensis]|uniref:Uncharacterized protein n=2 Tax=Acetobacter cibinongensis TaxID=146475 RepID=A0A1Z5YV07_9PROT|nr:hypothetical protein HK14_06265 [Acetobacter cibinongensis]
MEADDYINFLRDFRNIIGKDIVYNEEQSSLHNCVVGFIGDVKIFFLHYQNIDDAKDSWTRRVSRLPASDDDILFQISDRDGFTEKTLEEFSKLPYKNKIGFITRGKYNNFDENIFHEIDWHEDVCPPGVMLGDMTFDIINSKYKVC